MKIDTLFVAIAIALACVLAGAVKARAQDAAAVADKWPREFNTGTATLRVHQPQVNSWQGDVIEFRAAVGATPNAGKEMFGVIRASARTQVNRAARLVVLEDLTLTRSSFPTLRDQGASHLRALQKQFAPAASRTVALDRLEASLAASGAMPPADSAANTDPAPAELLYAGHNGNVYRNNGSAWEQYTANGWQSPSSNTAQAEKEQQARAEATKLLNQRTDDLERFIPWNERGGAAGWANRYGTAAPGRGPGGRARY